MHSMRVEIPTPGYHLITFSYSSRYSSIEFLLSPSAISTYSIFPETKSDTFNLAGSNLQRLLTGIMHDLIQVNIPPFEYLVFTSDILLVIFATY